MKWRESWIYKIEIFLDILCDHYWRRWWHFFVFHIEVFLLFMVFCIVNSTMVEVPTFPSQFLGIVVLFYSMTSFDCAWNVKDANKDN